MAAAFAALVSLQHNLNLIKNHSTHTFSFEEKQIESLAGSVTFLIDFMKSYDNSHGARKEGAQALEMRIARAAQAAEDVIESHVVDQIRSGKTTRSDTRSSRFLLELQKVIEDMDYMRRKAINVQVRSGMEAEQPTYSAAAATSSTPLTSNKTTSTMVGFDDALLQLLDQLTGKPSSRRIIPIVGMGGIGKTTLAINAFENPLIVDHFDVCLWATISQQYSVEKILTELLSGLTKFTSEIVDDVRSVMLHKSLYGRRYLIILDDMWNVEVWDEIKSFFPDTQCGSRIVVTTRHSHVARHLSSSWRAMRFLNGDDSWDLFCQKAFAEEGCPPELEDIGTKIVEKCRGLPLTIVVVGGHLRNSSMAVEYWEIVAHQMNSILNSTENEHCLNVLSLSYSYLPAHLKPCFLLLGAFPEDEVIVVEDVVRLWIAEGFVEDFKYTRLEVSAEYYIWDLFQRNLILVYGNDFQGKITSFKVHDLVRELCLKIAKEEEFLYVYDTSQAINRERRVVIRGRVGDVNRHPLIRCLIYEGGWLSSDLKLLRTLNKVVASSTSESIFQQVNLRFLNVEFDYKSHRSLYLPSSISLLWNLKILKIAVPTHSTVVAPYEIWEMLQLRHVEVYTFCLLDPLPVDRLDQSNDFRGLKNLHTLEWVENLRLSEEVCKRIPNIRRLQLSYCDEANSYYCPHNLGNFHELEFLTCQFNGNFKWRDFSLSLTFPSSLKRLQLSGCGVDWEELTIMVGSLPNLLNLQLFPDSVIGSVWAPVEGKFLRLKALVINRCDDLINWNVDSFHFPVLEYLHLKRLSKLNEFPSGIGEIPTLRYIKLTHCSEALTFSAMRTLVEQEELGNEGLKLHVHFQGDEKTIESFNKKVQEEGLTRKNLFLHLKIVKLKSF